MAQEQDYAQQLKAVGLKNTRQRAAILAVLSQGVQPYTAEEIYLALKTQHTNISLSTVYRALETMSSKGALQRVTLSGDNRMAYTISRAAHRHYLVCSRCKKTLPIAHCPLGAYEKALADETGFVIEGHRLDIYGLCPDCQREKKVKAE